MAEQFCEKHDTFRPCQECAKGDVWDGEALIFKRDAEKRIQELEAALEKYGKHEDDCNVETLLWDVDGPDCTCGLEQALEGGKNDT